MDTHRKNAYRYLLYWAMLDIRMMTWCNYLHGWRKLNPLNWRRYMHAMRLAAGLADWLHNLAPYASEDFTGFDEDRFWRDCEGVTRRCPDFNPKCYRDIFEERLRQLEAGHMPT